MGFSTVSLSLSLSRSLSLRVCVCARGVLKPHRQLQCGRITARSLDDFPPNPGGFTQMFAIDSLRGCELQLTLASSLSLSLSLAPSSSSFSSPPPSLSLLDPLFSPPPPSFFNVLFFSLFLFFLVLF